MSAYAASDDVVVYLINQSVNGSAERRLAARFILDCLRNFQTRAEIAACIHTLEDEAILDVGREARLLAGDLGLLAVATR
jgi:hypothetical protein